MKPTAGFLKRFAMAGAFAVMCGLSGPALAQGDGSAAEPNAGPPYVSLGVSDERRMTTGEFARMMERIVWARCLSVEVRELGPAIVETYFEFEILETVKGTFANGRKPGARFTVAVREGEAGESRTESQPPYPKFQPGDEAVLLVGPDSRDGKAIISPTQSTYRVQTDAQGRKTVTPRPTGMTLYRAANGKPYERRLGLILLEDFLLSLQKHVSDPHDAEDPPEPTLGKESAAATFSELARETGGSFIVVDPFDPWEYKQAMLSTIDASFGPAVAAVTPRKWFIDGGGNTVVDVEITGGKTSFNGTSTLSFDVPDIIVNSLTVESPRRLIANLTVTGGSVADLMTVTTDLGGGAVEITTGITEQHFWLIETLVPAVTTLRPNRMMQGDTGDVTVRGVLTNFVDGVSAADFGPGVTVNLFRVLDPVTAIANVTIDLAAATGFHAVTVTTGAEIAASREVDVFQITPPPAAIPRLASVTPTSLARGQTADLAITGLNTGFVDQTSFLDLIGTGVTVNSLTVTSRTEAIANVTVAPDAPLGYLDAVVVTGGEDAAGLDAFTVTP